MATTLLAIALVAILSLAGTVNLLHAQTGVPDRPTGLTTSSVTHNSITLTWDDPGDSSITGYQVLRRSRDGEQYGDGEGASTFVAVVGDTGSSATTYTDTSVTAHSRYVYRVKARNSEGLGPRSSYVNVETSTAPSAPDAPTGLTVSSFTHNSVTLAWDDSGDSGITGYQVLRRDLVKQDPGIFSIAAADTGTAATTYTDTDVAANTRYAYRVEAINAEGNSGRSNYVNVKTSAAPSVLNSVSVKSLPAKPSGLELSVALDNSVTFEWDDPGDSSITHYKVLRRVGDSGKFSTIEENTGSADTSYTDTTVSAELGVAAGLRVSEALALEVADLSLDADLPTIRVRSGKGRKAKVVPDGNYNVQAGTGYAGGEYTLAYGETHFWRGVSIPDLTNGVDVHVAVCRPDCGGC